MKKIVIGILSVLVCTAVLPIGESAKADVRAHATFYGGIGRSGNSRSANAIVHSIDKFMSAAVQSEIKIGNSTVARDYSHASYMGLHGTAVSKTSLPTHATARNGIKFDSWEFYDRNISISF